MSGFPKSSRYNIRVALEKQVLIISLGAKLKIGKCKAIRDWFLANEFADLRVANANRFAALRATSAVCGGGASNRKASPMGWLFC